MDTERGRAGRRLRYKSSSGVTSKRHQSQKLPPVLASQEKEGRERLLSVLLPQSSPRGKGTIPESEAANNSEGMRKRPLPPLLIEFVANPAGKNIIRGNNKCVRDSSV